MVHNIGMLGAIDSQQPHYQQKISPQIATVPLYVYGDQLEPCLLDPFPVVSHSGYDRNHVPFPLRSTRKFKAV